MLCPNCGLEQPDAPECKRCGVIVTRYRPPETRPRPSASAGHQSSPPPAPPFFDMFRVIIVVCIVIFLISFLIFRVDNDTSGIKIFLVIMAIAFLAWWWAGKRRQKALERMAAELGGKVVMPSFNVGYFSLKTEAGECTVNLIPSSKRHASRLDLCLKPTASIGFSFHMGTSTFANRPIPGLGKKRSRDEFKTGDPGFDEKYWMRGDDQARLTRFFQDLGRREAMEYFFRNGFTELYSSPKAVTAVKKNYLHADLEPELIRMHLEQLGKLIAA